MLKGHLRTFLLGNHYNLLTMRSHKQGYLWEVELISRKVICHHCGQDKTVKAGKRFSLVKEDPIKQRALWLKIHKHRIYCKLCKKYFVERVPGVFPKRRSTQRFRKTIAQACATMNDLATVSKFYGVSSGFAQQVYYEQIEVKLRERIQQRKWPEVIGIDEHFFRRKNGFTEFTTMITNLKEKSVFEMVHGKAYNSLEEQLKDIPGRENVKIVVIDMSSSYKSFIRRFFPNARIIADKFHVLRLFTPAIMKTGKDIHGHRKELGTRRKLLYSRTKLDYFVRVEIDRYLNQHEKLKEIYRWKERLMEFYRTKGYERAKKAFNKLLLQMELSSLEEVQKVLRTFKRWKHEILKYFDKGYTNGFTERMNGTGKLVQRRAFGYKNFRNYRLRVLSVCLFKTF